MTRVIITGCCGFIGSHFVDRLLKRDDIELIIGIDAMTYASKTPTIEDDRFCLLRQRCESIMFDNLCAHHKIDTIIHFAAETHVDNSIVNVQPFVESNIHGTLAILEGLKRVPHVRLVHVSTDEVFGGDNELRDESSAYAPTNPYAATKASSDHLVRAFAKTFDLRCVVTHCTNNFGPRQHEEKLIPKTISRVMSNESIPIYGNGMQRRDWLFVDDHCHAIELICDTDFTRDTFCISTGVLRTNLEVVRTIIDFMDRDEDLIEFVEDRPAHDRQYRLDSSKVRRELSWNDDYEFEDALRFTIDAECRRAGWR
jgi:dTDP-glucose 4,6-dehydratase